MLPSSCARWLCCAFLLLSQLALGADWRTPAAQLAEKLSAATGPGVIALDITNRSSISAADVEQVRHLLVSDLAASGVRVWQPDQAAAIATVTLSENLQSYVWVAQIQQGSAEPSLAMVSLDRPASSAASQNSPLMVLRATTLMSAGAAPVSEYVAAAPAELRDDVEEVLPPIDPLSRIGDADGAVFLQAGRSDSIVPESALQALADAAPDGTRVTWYDAEHDLNDSANRDQLAWLSERLGIDGPPVPGVATGP